VLFASSDFRVFSASGHYLSTEFLWCQLDAAALEKLHEVFKESIIKHYPRTYEADLYTNRREIIGAIQ
jgi:hypothetical protein